MALSLFIDTEKNVNNIVGKLRTALGDGIQTDRDFLETNVRKGYRFVGPVRVIDAKYPLSDSEQALSAAGRGKMGELGRAVLGRRSSAVAAGESEGRMTNTYFLILRPRLYHFIGKSLGRGRAANLGSPERTS